MNSPDKFPDTSGYSMPDAAQVAKDAELTREIIEAKYGRTWNTQELQQDYSVKGFAAPFVIVERKADGQKGTLQFTHLPRFYFDFIPE